MDYIGGYHVDNVSLGQINGGIRRTFSVKPKIISAVNAPEGSAALLEVYQSGQTLFLKSELETNVQLNLYNITGKLIISANKPLISNQTTSYELPEYLSHGVYTLTISINQKKTTFKVLI